MINILENRIIGGDYKCFYCGVDGFKMTKDHFYPKSKGGKLIVYSCSCCNKLKKDYSPIKWVELVKKSSHPNKNYIIKQTEKLLRECVYVFKNGMKIKLSNDFF